MITTTRCHNILQRDVTSLNSIQPPRTQHDLPLEGGHVMSRKSRRVEGGCIEPREVMSREVERESRKAKSGGTVVAKVSGSKCVRWNERT
jgi:hypothetical protein